MEQREIHHFLAELAGEAERYNDVIAEIKEIVSAIDKRLTTDERNLISVAYKNLTNTLRNSWRTVDTLEKAELARPGKKHLALLKRQRSQIETELTTLCQDLVRLLDDHLVPNARAGEEVVFYTKMKADYYRYLAEVAVKSQRERYAAESLAAYIGAYRHAMANLSPIHPTRLGLALNFAVFYHDVRHSPDRACHLAKSALDEAIAVPDCTQAELKHTLQDSIMILQLLRDDLILWSSELQSDI